VRDFATRSCAHTRSTSHVANVRNPAAQREVYLAGGGDTVFAVAPLIHRPEDASERSLQWLGALANPYWSAFREHPILGTMITSVVLGSWVAHDHLHIRRLNQLQWKWLTVDTPHG
jgi:hypothetical protein